MTRYVFQLEVREGSQQRLRELNDRYEPALRRATGAIEGFGGLEKYILGDRYVELIDLEGDFGEFGRQLAADPEVREFLRSVNDCFVQPLREMGERRMDLVQRVEDGRSQAA